MLTAPNEDGAVPGLVHKQASVYQAATLAVNSSTPRAEAAADPLLFRLRFTFHAPFLHCFAVVH